MPRKHKRRRVGSTKRRRVVVQRVKTLHRAEGRAIRSLGSVTPHLNKAKAVLERKIAHAEIQKFKAKKKMTKRKIGKRIAAFKSQYRKLCS